MRFFLFQTFFALVNIYRMTLNTRHELAINVYVKCPLLLYEFNINWNVSASVKLSI